jgi:predicted signal transduction protein with EAL and GGDEF domain
VDKSFVKDILHDPKDAVITRAVVAMGRSLDITVVAEGVESIQHTELLLGVGCDQARRIIADERFRQNDFRRCLRQSKASDPREKPAEDRYASIKSSLPS